MRRGFGPPRSVICSSTSSAIVRTCRGFRPLVITNQSVMASTSPTSSTRVSAPCLSAAALAATTTHSWERSLRPAPLAPSTSGIAPCLVGAVLCGGRLEVAADHHRNVHRVVRYATEDDLADAQSVPQPLGDGLVGLVVEH